MNAQTAGFWFWLVIALLVLALAIAAFYEALTYKDRVPQITPRVRFGVTTHPRTAFCVALLIGVGFDHFLLIHF